MPIIKSAKKRVKQAKKAAIRNSKTKRSIKSSIKLLKISLDKKSKDTPKNLSKVQSSIDKAAKKRVIHKNKASRLKSRMAKLAKEASRSNVKKSTTKKDKN